VRFPLSHGCVRLEILWTAVLGAGEHKVIGVLLTCTFPLALVALNCGCLKFGRPVEAVDIRERSCRLDSPDGFDVRGRRYRGQSRASLWQLSARRSVISFEG